MRIRHNKLVNLFIVLCISLGFIVYQFWEVPADRVWNGLKQAQVSWLVAGMVVMCGYWFLESVVLHQMAKKVKQKQTLWQSIKITMVGQFFNTITPFSSGGQPAQLYTMTKHGLSVSAGSSILLMKFIVFQSMMVVSSMVVLLFGYDYLQSLEIPQIRMLVFTGFVMNVLVITSLITIAKSKRVASFLAHSLLKPVSWFVKEERYITWKKKLGQKLISFHEESKQMSFDYSFILCCCVLTLIQLWLFFSIPFFITQALGVTNIHLFQVIAYHAFIMMFSSLVPIPGGSGGAEYSFSLLFGLLLPPTMLVLCLFFWRLITYYSCIVFGSFFLLSRRKA